MKSTKILFLFLLLSLIKYTKLNAQDTIIDSTQYYIGLIENQKHFNHLIDGFHFFQNKKRESIELGNKWEIFNSLYYISDAQRKMGDIYESEKSLIEALSVLDNMDVNDESWKEKTKVTTYISLGIISRNLLRFEKAIKYYDQVIEISKKLNDSSSLLNISKAHGNKGHAYKEWGKYPKAITEYKKAIKIALTLEDSKLVARLYDNLGSIKSELELPDAIKDLQKGLSIREYLNFDQGIITSYMNLSEHYYREDDFKLASFYINEALKIGDESNNSTYKEAAISIMIDQGDYSRVKEYKKITDSIKTSTILNDSKYSEAKYNYKKKEKELQKSELESERLKKVTLIYLLSGLLVFVGSIFLFFILKSKHKKDKIKEAYLTEVELSKKVHDELANDMSDLMNYVENDIDVSNQNKSKLLDNIEDLYLRTRNISTQTASIDLANFSEGLSNLLLQHNRTGTKVVTNDINSISWENVPDHKKMIIYRCLQELMVNMKKHSKAKLVSIVFKNNTNKNEIRYVDDGIGFSIEGIKLNGLANVESRIKSIQGTFSFTTSKGNGFKASLKFNS